MGASTDVYAVVLEDGWTMMAYRTHWYGNNEADVTVELWGPEPDSRSDVCHFEAVYDEEDILSWVEGAGHGFGSAEAREVASGVLFHAIIANEETVNEAQMREMRRLGWR